jgi:hypothetical protein
LLADALAAVIAIGDESERARALGSLARHLSPELLADALAAAIAIGDEWNHADALGSLAPHLSPRLIADALAAAIAIGDESERARALGSLVPLLPAELMADALAAAKAIGNEEVRASTLDLLATYVLPSQYVSLLFSIIELYVDFLAIAFWRRYLGPCTFLPRLGVMKHSKTYTEPSRTPRTGILNLRSERAVVDPGFDMKTSVRKQINALDIANLPGHGSRPIRGAEAVRDHRRAEQVLSGRIQRQTNPAA